MSQRAIVGPYVYFVTTNTTNREIFFVAQEQAVLLGRIIQNACRLKNFDLFGYCILPNHIHLLVHNRNAPQRGFRNPRCGAEKEYTLSHLMHAIKRNFSRQQPNSGRLWQPRFNFRIIDNEPRFFNTMEYIKYNYRKMNLPEMYGRHPWVWIDHKKIDQFFNDHHIPSTTRGLKAARG